jgi:hypothetical protein
VFVGSSSEGLEVADHFQGALESKTDCEVQIWDQDVFAVGYYTMDSLVEAAQGADFAVLIASADDTTSSRGSSAPTPRDNIVFELGLFMGALGLERTFILCSKVRAPRLPSDLAGVTRLPAYDDRPNVRSAVNAAAVTAASAIKRLGRRNPALQRTTPPPHADAVLPSFSDQAESLAAELALLRANVSAQGWRERSSATTLRFYTPKGRTISWPLSADPERARNDLRQLARRLRSEGLRVNNRVLQPLAAGRARR